VQAQFGYTSELAGLALSPGGIGAIAAIVFASGPWLKMPNHLRIALGLAGLGAAMFNLGRITPDIDFTSLVWMRVLQAASGAFIFVPLSTISYATMPLAQLRDATCLMSMIRNMMSSIGVSVTTAMVTQRTQVHMGYLSQHMSPYESAFTQSLSRGSATLNGLGTPGAQATVSAAGAMYRTLIRQSNILGYHDVFQMTGLLALSVIPLAFLIRPPKVALDPAVLGH
jgi:DHA2 family multidrug resistance protein